MASSPPPTDPAAIAFRGAPPATPPAAGFERAVELFVGRTRHTRTGSPHTERAYRTDLAHFGAFLGERRLSYADVARRDAEAYLVGLSATFKPRTVRRRVSCLRSLYRFLRGVEIVARNPFDALDLPAFDRKSETHKVLTDDELERAVALLSSDLVAALRRLEEAERARGRNRAFADLFTSARRRVTVTLMAFGGLRCGEVLGLSPSAFVSKPDGYYLSFTGKGSKVRTVPLAGLAYPAMVDWLAVRRRVPVLADRLFVTLAGQALDPAQLFRECVRLGERVEARVSLTPHVLRRTFATRTLRQSGDLRGVQELLGHATLATTEVYTHVDEAGLRHLVEDAAVALPGCVREHERGPVLHAGLGR
ncbi:tyrosine-type recombinase/integrase [Rubrivirga sp. S365]|uniref:tyrosine-type recombinase/integrase n=1 Tax=Rubrivirga sp. S365 TaxID=3076080 RepID=UPI0028C98B0D|nr:tyrosine-type recombinase/integrase [Rubrivirga sp. S365]MDT7858157.1 tyrosine-type recombinase/integrase [Rubrivirga sp. S365]